MSKSKWALSLMLLLMHLPLACMDEVDEKSVAIDRAFWEKLFKPDGSDFSDKYCHLILQSQHPLIITMHGADGKKIKVMNAADERKVQILTFGALARKQSELLQLKVKGSKCAAAQRSPYYDFISRIVSFIRRFCQREEEWEQVIENARFLLTRNNLLLWYGMIIDSLFGAL